VGKSVLVTHPNIDLDAAACIAAIEVDVEDVEFVSASATELPSELKGARVVDHPLGVKGKKDADGTQHSAFASLPEVEDIRDGNLVRMVDEQDSGDGSSGLGGIIAATRRYYITKGLSGEDLDRAILRCVIPMLKGYLIGERALSEARRAAHQIPIITIANFKMAIINNQEFVPMLGQVLGGEMGCVGSIFRDGFNIGITRYPGNAEPDLRRLQEHLPGWFIHSAGFLVAWGSRKAPAKEYPPEGTPRSPEELVEILRDVYK